MQKQLAPGGGHRMMLSNEAMTLMTQCGTRKYSESHWAWLQHLHTGDTRTTSTHKGWEYSHHLHHQWRRRQSDLSASLSQAGAVARVWAELVLNEKPSCRSCGQRQGLQALVAAGMRTYYRAAHSMLKTELSLSSAQLKSSSARAPSGASSSL